MVWYAAVWRGCSEYAVLAAGCRRPGEAKCRLKRIQSSRHTEHADNAFCIAILYASSRSKFSRWTPTYAVLFARRNVHILLEFISNLS